MNFKSLVFNTGMSLLMALPAFAARQENVTIVPRAKSVLEDSSEHQRIDKDYLLALQVGGAAVSPVYGTALTFGTYLNRNSILQFEISKGTTTIQGDSTTKSTTAFDLGASTAGVNYKHFFGNSFYTKLGADYRQITLSNFDSFFVNIDGVVGEVNSLTASLAIGNQWQWENFTMGCDWFGINPVLMTLGSKYENTATNAEDKKSLDKAWDNLAKVTSAQVLRLYLGTSF